MSNKYVVVIPSVREFPIEYFAPILNDVQMLVIDDSNGAAPRHKHPNITYMSHDFQDRYFAENFVGISAEDIIPRKNPSCKNFGLLFAYREKLGDVIILLDDDCDLRETPNYLEEIPVDKEVETYIFSGSSWVNTMWLLGETGMYPRGFPYDLRGGQERYTIASKATVNPMFNEGLWTGTADINGIDKLNGAEATAERDYVFDYNVRAGHSQSIPLSIMNVQLHRDLVPAFYQPPDYPAGDGFRVRRHDDVWSMMFLKACMDYNAHVATVGRPLIRHTKAGDMQKEILAEHITNLIQPLLFEAIERNRVGLLGTSFEYAECAEALADNILFEYNLPGAYNAIITHYAASCRTWARLCRGDFDR